MSDESLFGSPPSENRFVLGFDQLNRGHRRSVGCRQLPAEQVVDVVRLDAAGVPDRQVVWPRALTVVVVATAPAGAMTVVVSPVYAVRVNHRAAPLCSLVT